MKFVCLMLAVVAAGCFSPDYVSGTACSAEATCPEGQNCLMGTCWVAKTDEECTGLVTINLSQPNACPDSDTTLRASIGSRYQWSTGETTRSIKTRAAGTYRVAVDGCTSPELVLAAAPAPVVTFTGPTQICPIHGETTVLTADEHAEYLWSTGETTRSIVVDTPGAYTVQTDDCVTSAPAQVAPPTPAVITRECQGTLLTLKAGTARSYAWSNGGTTQSIPIGIAGPYYVTVDGCSTSTTHVVQPAEVASQPVTIPFTGSAVTFSVPACVSSMTIEAKGGQGGGKNSGGAQDGGKGARAVGTFTVTPGEILNVVVGQMGATAACFSPNGGGQGGGGSFVWRASDVTFPLLAAGGGGGSSPGGGGTCTAGTRIGRPGQAATATGLALAGSFNTAGRGGAAGNNGTGGGAGSGTGTANHGAGGGGWLTAGANFASGNCSGGTCFGGSAGAGGGGNFAGGAGTLGGLAGAFGGGGSQVCGGGGGGGFSGGGGGEGSTDVGIMYCAGGGGGSFNRGTSPIDTSDVQSGNGVVILTW